MLPTIKLRIEKWKWNKDYNLWVSNYGNFKDVNKQPVKQLIDKKGYMGVIDTNGQFIKSHHVVMNTWKPISNPLQMTVDHLNHNKRDNSVQNLEWVTKEENLKRATEDLYIDDNYSINERTLKILEETRALEKKMPVSNINKYDVYSRKNHHTALQETGLTYHEICDYIRKNEVVSRPTRTDYQIRKAITHGTVYRDYVFVPTGSAAPRFKRER